MKTIITQSKIDFDDYAEKYQKLVANQTAFFSKDVSYFGRIKAQIGKEISVRTDDVLDFGCGTGSNTRLIQETISPARMVGFDPSKKSIQIAKKNNGNIVFTSRRQDLTKRKFDLILLSGVVHHIPVAERLGEFKFLRGLMHAGSRLVIFEHNPWNPITRKLVRECEFDEDAVLLTKRNLENVAKSASLKLVESGYYLLSAFMEILVEIGALFAVAATRRPAFCWLSRLRREIEK